nr:MAG TPA: DNA polymerase I [Bacteriophage sp.]
MTPAEKPILHIDIETYSSVDLRKSGLYKYVQSPDFEILLFAYAYNQDPVQIVDLAAGEKLPEALIKDLSSPGVLKMAHNAAFEVNALSRFYDIWPDQWQCTMIHALYCGYPGSLAAVGKALGFEESKQKMSAGKALIRYFCMPCKPTKTNGGRTRNFYHHETKKWELFKVYCMQDVEVEREIENSLKMYPVPAQEWDAWHLDQMVNREGTKVDMDLVQGAIQLSKEAAEKLGGEIKNASGIENPNSVAQIRAWVEGRLGREISGLGKDTLDDLLQCADVKADPAVYLVLKKRREMAKSSVKKYDAMQSALCEDGRIRGLLQFYGANRTGRWAGRLVQVQNLPRNYIPELSMARDLVKRQNSDAIETIYGSVPDFVSQLIRTAFVPREGHEFVVADFSAIEARVISWLAAEEWRLEVFRTHGKIYEASASSMFGVPIEKISKGHPEYALRAKGKVAELALGYQGSKVALVKMGALNMGLTEEELPDIVSRWRASNKRIVDFWYLCQNCAAETVEYGVINQIQHGITFSRDENFLRIQLPSGRTLFYPQPGVRENSWGSKVITYMGVGATKKWEQLETYGGKLVENIVQAVARDLLANAIRNMMLGDYIVNFHIHDEIVAEVPKGSGLTLDRAIELMCKAPAWAEGLPLNADGFTGDFYKKE